MKKQIKWIVLLIVITTLTILQAIPDSYAEEKTVKILHGKDEAEQISIQQEQKEILKAVVTGFEAENYQWQILMDPENSLWVNVQDKTEAECEVSNALVNSLLDESNSAYLRCRVSYDADMLYSTPVCVTVLAGIENPDYDYMSKEVVEEANAFAMKGVSAIPVVSDDVVTITIKYLDYHSKFIDVNKFEKEIYTSYKATVEKNTSFSQSVISPTFLGFAPFYEEGDDSLYDEDATVVNIDIASVASDTVFEVYYKPVKVSYAIRYFFQNINDDLYTENVGGYYTSSAETGTIISDEEIMSHAGDTKGFQKLYHYPESVAADGSTVFECYYDRNYHLIQFDMGGGYGVEPIYARYDAPFLVNDPIRQGYNFDGWELVKIDGDNDGEWDADGVWPSGTQTTMMDKIPSYDCYYRAKWTAKNNVKVDIVYWLQDANDETQYNYWGSYELYNQKSGDTLNGIDFESYSQIADELDENEKKYSVFNSSKSNENVEVRGDGTTAVNVYYDRKDYELKFYYAASEGNGSDIIYKVVGGSTYYFGTLGKDAQNKNDEISLMDYEYGNWSSEWGKVANLPELKDEYKTDYILGFDEANNGTLSGNGVKYYYITYKDRIKYGADITDIWPCDKFKPVERAGRTAPYKNGWSGTSAVLSAWNGEYSVYYSQKVSSNQTIKGKYEKLDYRILFDTSVSGVSDSGEVAYLAFWENGSDGNNWNVPRLWIYKQWIPILSTEDASLIPEENKKTKNGIQYRLYKGKAYNTCDNNQDVGSQTQVSLEGYKSLDGLKEKEDLATNPDPANYASAHVAHFYYEPLLYNLKFNSSGSEVLGKGGIVKYGESMAEKFFVPDYPNNLEEDAFEFAGWFTSPGCITTTSTQKGTEYGKENFVYDDVTGRYKSSSFANYYYPAHDMELYAKWVPVVHKVKFFVDYSSMKQYEANSASVTPYLEKDLIEHGNVVGSVINPTKEGDGSLPLIFSGWFYMDGGVKKAYTPLDMPINRDMNVFADWSSNAPQPYKIQYVLKDSPSTKVTDDTTGYAYGGSTRTFIPKAGNPFNQLYIDYNEGFFPTVGSHSITMEYEPDSKNPIHNVYTFEYVHAIDIKYTVRYVNKETNLVMDEKEYKTNNSVVTERFVAYPNMVPDAFYKRLVLAVEYDEVSGKWVGSDDNVITFYYTPNATSAYYAVHFMVEKLNATDADRAQYKIDGTGGYEEATTCLEGVGDINTTIPITPQTFNGFLLISDQAVSVVNGVQSNCPYKTTGNYEIKINESGTELYVFYKRLEYKYTVNYFKHNTTTLVDETNFPTETGNGRYGATITKVAPDIPGYTCVSAKTTQNMLIRDKEEQNVITFYYSPIEYRIEYIIVTQPTSEPPGGTLTTTLEVLQGSALPKGSKPVVNKYYEFDGWYKDEECTIPIVNGVDGTLNASTGEFIPDKEKLDAKNGNKFYAKFIKLAGDFTIIRSNADANIDANRVFVYEVKNDETDFVMQVTVTGNGSTTICDLPFGKYTVIQKNDWSWRYTDTALTGIEHDDAEGSKVTFYASRTTGKWLNGNSPLRKQVRGE